MRAPMLAPCASRIVGIGQTGYDFFGPVVTTSVVAARWARYHRRTTRALTPMAPGEHRRHAPGRRRPSDQAAAVRYGALVRHWAGLNGHRTSA